MDDSPSEHVSLPTSEMSLDSISSIPTTPESAEESPIKIQPPTELQGLTRDRKLEKLKFLVDRSKIYASILTERLAKPETPQEPEKSAATADKPSSKRAKRSKALRFTEKTPDVDTNTSNNESSRSVAHAMTKIIKGVDMQPYQLDGVEWLVSLFENGLNGILADEMGLGKTLQTIAFLAYLIDQGISGPYLIVAPMSTLTNWLNEFARFTPNVKALKYYGTKEERAEIRESTKQAGSWQVMVTSYDIIMRDAKHLRDVSWKYLIVDEGQRLKNMNCALITELKRFDSANRLLLTGTPLQNNLAELWSLLNFILPDVFTDLALFQQWFDSGEGSNVENHMGKKAASALISNLHEILRPFLLRRLKSEVLTFLPPKKEYIIYCGLSDTQIELYHALLKRTGKEYIIKRILQSRGYGETNDLDSIINDGGLPINTRKSRTNTRFNTRTNTRTKRSRHVYKENTEEEDDEMFRLLDNGQLDNISIITGEPNDARLMANTEKLTGTDNDTRLMIRNVINEVSVKSFQNLMMQLRLACNSPYQFYFPWSDNDPVDNNILHESGKMMILKQLTDNLVQNNHKFLIFSQFTKTLDLIEEYFIAFKPKWKYCRIDGSVKQSERQAQIDKFSNDANYKGFLLSTRSGGLGINLAAADTVIIFDSDWNPQQDLQAMDRVHRITQKQPVIVYRFATAGTVEERLLERAADKRKLENIVIEQGRFRGFGLSANSVEEAIKELEYALDKNIERRKKEVGLSGVRLLSQSELDLITNRSEASYTAEAHAKLADDIVLIEHNTK